MHMNHAAQPCLRGFPLKVKLTCGYFHCHAHAPMLLLHGANCAVSLQSHHLVLGCASLSKFVDRVSFSQVRGQFLIVRQCQDGCFLCNQSGLIEGLLHVSLAFTGPKIQAQAVS